jgi:hypothetical protein
MDRAVKTIAAVQGASSTVVRDMFRGLVARWQSSARIAGVLEENHGQENQVCGAGYLRSIASGARYSMFQDLGPARRLVGSIRRACSSPAKRCGGILLRAVISCC